MGYFTDSFEIGAGATFGALTAVSATKLADNLAKYAMNGAYTKYRQENFDGVVFNDLDNLLAYGSLPETPYPFSQGSNGKTSDWQRTVILAGFAIALVVTLAGISMVSSETGEILMGTGGGIFLFFMMWGIVHLIGKAVKKGAKKAGDMMYRERLDNDGSQYWLVREHVRCSLADHSMDLKEAFRRLSSTNLGQQFPYTLDYIEAHAYQYKLAHQR